MLDIYRAAKIIKKDSQNINKILREANLIKNLEHPGIPLIYDIEEDSNSICIIEEYIAGKSLREYMSKNKPLDISSICNIGIQLCNILKYIHNCGRSGIIHLDLKPDNIIIDKDTHVWIIDFDNAVFANEQKKKCEGSPLFAAPEQYHRLKPDKRADIYSLGMLLLYMANNQDVQSCIETIHKHILYPIIKKCLHHQPGKRYMGTTQIHSELLKVQHKFNNQDNNNYEHSIVIIVKGARHGIGATHVCLSMASFLSENKINVVCIDKSRNHHMFQEAVKGTLMNNGTYLYKGVFILPDYGDEIKCPLEGFSIFIVDCAGGWKDSLDNIPIDSKTKIINICICDGKYGGTDESKLIKSSREYMAETAIFVNHTNGMQFYEYLGNQSCSEMCYHVPCIYQWFNGSEIFRQTMCDFIEEMIPEINIKKTRNWMEKLKIENAWLAGRIRVIMAKKRRSE